MADFPFGNAQLGPGSTITFEDGVELTRATNGTVRGRNLYTSKKAVMKLEFPYLTSAQKTSLLSHYDGERTGTGFNYTWQDGTVYSCLYVQPPEVVPQLGGYYTASVSLVQK